MTDNPIATDDELDEVSRDLLDAIGKLRELELEVRQHARGTPEFHALNREIEAQARHVFSLASKQRRIAEDDSPDPAERAERTPGDWSDGSTPRGAAT